MLLRAALLRIRQRFSTCFNTAGGESGRCLMLRGRAGLPTAHSRNHTVALDPIKRPSRVASCPRSAARPGKSRG
jgi:hypothetical protein